MRRIAAWSYRYNGVASPSRMPGGAASNSAS